MINILFMAIDFALFCACCVWFLKRHACAVKLEMEQEQLRSARLHEHREGLQKQVHETHRATEEQAQVCHDLSSKIMVWKQHFEEHAQRTKATREIIAVQMHEKYYKQMEFRQQEHYQHEIATAVVANVRAVVKEKFSARSAHEQYNNASLRLLEHHKRSL